MAPRTVTRAALAFLLAALGVTALTSPGSAGQAPPEVIVTGRAICPDDQFEVTISNPGAQTYQVQIDVDRSIGQDESIPVTIDPAETETVAVAITGTPMDVAVTGDLDFPDELFSTIFRCPATVDLTATTPVDTPVVIDLVGPCSAGPETPNGTVEQVDNFTIRYTPDTGFVGVDSFPYSCSTSAEQEGTVTVTVTPLQVPPAEPIPEAPTFTG